MTNKPVILLTGATGTIGRAIASALSTQAVDCIFLGRNKKKLLELNERAHLVQMDLLLASPENFANLAEQIQQHYGRLDALVHCAGIFQGLTPLANHTSKQFLTIMHANATAPYFLTQTLLPLLQKSPKGQLIFTLNPERSAYWGAYAMAASATQTMCDLYQEELAQSSIQVCGVNPGRVESPLQKKTSPFGPTHALISSEQAAQLYLTALQPLIKAPVT